MNPLSSLLSDESGFADLFATFLRQFDDDLIGPFAHRHSVVIVRQSETFELKRGAKKVERSTVDVKSPSP